MRSFQRAGAAALLTSFFALGLSGAMAQSAWADDVPIVVGKPIIKKDPPQPPKGSGEGFHTAVAGGEGQP